MESVLTVCLAFSLLRLLLPDDRNAGWLDLLIIIVLFLFVASLFSRAEWEPQSFEPSPSVTQTAFPEKEALHAAVRERVRAVTGEYPYTVESDFEREGDSYSLSELSLILRSGNAQEVCNDLQKTFGFQNVTVTATLPP